MLDTWDRFWMCIATPHEQDVLYVYHIDTEGKLVKPYLFRSAVSEEVPAILRDVYGGGTFQVLIRRGRKMLLSSRISIKAPRSKTRSDCGWAP